MEKLLLLKSAEEMHNYEPKRSSQSRECAAGPGEAPAGLGSSSQKSHPALAFVTEVKRE